MKYFSYNDYIDYVYNQELMEAMKLEERNVKYNITSENISKSKQDKIIKKLNNKKNVCKLLNHFLNFRENVKIDEIQKSKEIKIENIQGNYILYELKNRGIYVYFEHLDHIDYNMAYKCLSYSIEIIRNWKEINSNIKNLKYPIVIPIVIYTGHKKWDAKESFKDLKLSYTKFEDSRINLAYNIINVKDFEKVIDNLPIE